MKNIGTKETISDAGACTPTATTIAREHRGQRVRRSGRVDPDDERREEAEALLQALVLDLHDRVMVTRHDD